MPVAQPQRDQSGAESADISLAFGADVEEARVISDRDSEARKNKIRRVVQRVAKSLLSAERTRSHQFERGPRTLAQQPDDRAGQQQRDPEIDQREQYQLGPARKSVGRVHGPSRNDALGDDSLRGFESRAFIRS